MSLRPSTEKMHAILKEFRAPPRVYHLPNGLELPKHFVIFHEHSDHYSLQTTEPVTLQGGQAGLGQQRCPSGHSPARVPYGQISMQG
jgi:hypothetical protein